MPRFGFQRRNLHGALLLVMVGLYATAAQASEFFLGEPLSLAPAEISLVAYEGPALELLPPVPIDSVPYDAVPFDESLGPSRPTVLREPESLRPPVAIADAWQPQPMFVQPFDAPLGFSGRSSIVPRETPQSSHFVPVEDRWRVGFPTWDRYGRGHPLLDDYPYDVGGFANPYKQNVIKGDYPIIGQHTFLNITLSDVMINEYRQVPTPANSFESTQNPGESGPFGNPNQYSLQNYTSVSFDLSHGDSSFKPADWRIRLTPVFNENYLETHELGVVSPDVQEGRTRYRSYGALQEWFVETKLADLSADYDFLSLRVGAQPFVSDFRGFVFADTNRAVRLFGTRLSNREQFNLAFFSQLEKDTNSFLNTFNDRHQQVLVANYYRQDTFFPGYTAQLSFHYNHDDPSTHFDDDGFLVRPDAAGVFQPHRVDACYLGWAGDGHINQFNITHQFYYVFGNDSLNPMAGQQVDIQAEMAAVELSYDRDWMRFRTSYFFASGQKDLGSTTANGFDTIFDNPNFAGGQFSFWQRQALKLNGVNLVNRGSLVPNLRSSKIEGQSNFFNPGLQLINMGADFDLTPKLRLITNANFLWFDHTAVLQQFLFQDTIHREIGTDISIGTEYRPLLSNNIIFIGGISALIPAQGLHDIYDNVDSKLDTMYAIFSEVTLTY